MNHLQQISAMVIITLATPAFAQPVGIPTFPDLISIKKWAEKESWGGNQVEVFRFKEREVAVVRRSFTSGIQSCGLSVFINGKHGWEEGLRLRNFHGYWLKVAQDGDFVISNNAATGDEVARISISGLSLQSFETDKK